MLSRFPEDFSANYLKGAIFLEQEEYAKALVHLKKCSGSDPENQSLAMDLAECFYKSGQYKFALPYLKKAHQELPGDVYVSMMLAFSYFKTGGTSEAHQLFFDDVLSSLEDLMPTYGQEIQEMISSLKPPGLDDVAPS